MSLALPSSSISIVDGGLGIVSPGPDSTFKIGSCSGGVAGTLYAFGPSAVQSVATTLGTGPLVDSVVHHLLESGKPVYAYKATASTAGASTAVTQVGTGPAITLTGAAIDQSESSIKIVQGGVIGTSLFQYTLDGGDTWSEVYATAATYLLPSGVTANMAAGTYVVDTTYSWTDTAPAMTTTNVGDALDALIVSEYDGEFIHVVGQTADASTCATMAALLATKITSSRAAHKYWGIIFEAPAVDKAGLVTNFASFLAEDVWGVAGFAEIINARTSLIQKRSVARVVVPRIARNPRAVQIFRDVGDSKLDPFPAIVKLVPQGAAASTGYHDEERTPGLQAARFTTCRTIATVPGFYASSAITMASNTSDYQDMAYRRIVLQAARIWYAHTVQDLGKRLRTDNETGFIDASFADSIETAGEEAIRAGLGDDIQDVRVLVNRADVLTSDPTLRATLRLTVGSYLRTYVSEIGLASSLPAAA